jgi:hypothetical protein
MISDDAVAELSDIEFSVAEYFEHEWHKTEGMLADLRIRYHRVVSENTAMREATFWRRLTWLFAGVKV